LFSDYRYIIPGQYTAMAEIPLPLTGFLGKNMAQVLFFVLYLASPGERVALGGALFSLHLRHDAILLLIS
jgi:hypothetical protein